MIEARLKRASEESVGIENYDYVIINDDLDESVVRLHEVIKSAHNRTLNNKSLIEDIREQIKIFNK